MENEEERECPLHKWWGLLTVGVIVTDICSSKRGVWLVCGWKKKNNKKRIKKKNRKEKSREEIKSSIRIPCRVGGIGGSYQSKKIKNPIKDGRMMMVIKFLLSS